MIFHSPYPDLQIPDTALTPLALRHADRLAAKPAIVDGLTGHGYTYGQLRDAIRAASSSLFKRGLRRGEVFAIYAPNSPDYAVAFHAIISLGGIVTTINSAATSDELARQLHDSSAAFLLTTPECLERATDALTRCPVRELFVLGDASVGTPFADLLRDPGAAPPVKIRPSEDLAALPYSSGTTGLPKGVMLTHANLAANVLQIAAAEPMADDDAMIGILPFFHIYGLTVLMNFALAVGATIATMSRFALEPFLHVLETHKVTIAPLVPPIVLALAKDAAVGRFDLSHLRLIISGAAPLGEEVAMACQQRVGCLVKQGYGLTESSPATHLGPVDPARVVPGSIGWLLPNTEAMIVDPMTGAARGPGQPGEIWVRGPQVMQGYLNRSEATAETITPDGWLRTGDLGSVDDDGNFFVVDRLKELIKYKAYQVAPAELEAILLSHPAVADAAVIPSPHEEAGEVPKAFVVLGAPATAEELMAFIAARVAPYKKVRKMQFIDQIPKSASGKILRRVLVERERESLRIPVLA